MAYKIDPGVLHKVAQDVVGLPVQGGEMISRAIELLAAEYPDLIDTGPGRWVGSKAGGILGKVRSHLNPIASHALPPVVSTMARGAN